MKEIKEIITAYHKAARSNKRSALGTVVHVESSSYRLGIQGGRVFMNVTSREQF